MCSRPGDRADLCTEVTWVCSNVTHRLGSRTKQDAVNHALVLEPDLSHWRRQGEDHVVVGHRQQLGLARLEPFGACQTLALLDNVLIAAELWRRSEPARSRRTETRRALQYRRRATELDRCCMTTCNSDPAEMSAMAATERFAVGSGRRLSATSSVVYASSRLRAAVLPRGGVGRVGLECREWCWSRPWAQRAVVFNTLRWPSSAWMMRMSVPLSSRCGGEAQLAQCDARWTRLPRPDRGTRRAAGGMQHDRVDRMLGIASGKQPVRGSRQCQYERRMPEQLCRRQHDVAVAGLPCPARCVDHHA